MDGEQTDVNWKARLARAQSALARGWTWVTMHPMTSAVVTALLLGFALGAILL